MAKQATADKRPRRERGSLNPEDILDAAFELAEQVSLDNMSMPMLGKHLDVGVTSIYWYFRKKDDLLNAMTDRALRRYTSFVTPFVDVEDWRGSLAEHARTMRATFLANPILCDLILIRSQLSPQAAQLGARQTEQVIATLVEAGFAVEDAVDIYSAIQLHVRGCVVLQRLSDKNAESGAESSAYYDTLAISPATTPLLAEAAANGLHSGAPDDHNFEYGLDCILDHADHLIGSGSAGAGGKVAAAKSARKTTAKAPAKRPASRRTTKPARAK
ncbi:TetR/AcrR family transcriptional regulator [Nocardia miyunensis]|uniref:TetR/AcrR family transcriptional regulator n=1 Tax=Nocardia miyunensis TaxID=282684 RepID=UPI00082D5195|nr:TetR/AcrR family transcriptional regulator C-terminal domain-containing protein [Nocardia miyunensis]